MLWQEGGVINTDDRGTSSGVSLVVYQREEGEETMNTIANRCITMHDKSSNGARSALTR